jgi:hypothetical protein
METNQKQREDNWDVTVDQLLTVDHAQMATPFEIIAGAINWRRVMEQAIDKSIAARKQFLRNSDIPERYIPAETMAKVNELYDFEKLMRSNTRVGFRIGRFVSIKVFPAVFACWWMITVVLPEAIRNKRVHKL